MGFCCFIRAYGVSLVPEVSSSVSEYVLMSFCLSLPLRLTEFTHLTYSFSLSVYPF